MKDQSLVNADLKSIIKVNPEIGINALAQKELLESEVKLLRDDHKEHLERHHKNKVTILGLESKNRELSNEIVKIQMSHLETLKFKNDTLSQLEKENRSIKEKSANKTIAIICLCLLCAYMVGVNLYLSGLIR
jgi:hypothetical protein